MAGFTFAIGVLGCRSNQEEVDCLRSQMMEMGGAEVRFPGPADVVVVNSCAVTATALSQSRQETRKAGRAKTGGLLIVTGCGAQMDPAWMARLEGVDLVAGNRAKERLGSLLEDLASFGPADAPFSSAALEELLAAGGETKKLHECQAGELPPTGWRPAFGPRDVGRGSWLLWEADPLPDRFARRTGPIPTRNSRAVLKIQDGCHFACAFCIVSSLRGEPRSRDRPEPPRRALP
ncbi:hypothetical protein ACFL6M_07610 [Candidatus Eisenbacteria bacterium]|uniref:MTTase N-terminal domain-containing protein n=1 Tax=Eiseniibacteriota bacterium TaxID=2212470 RepID=A0ABV6YMA4_UNCEI